MADSINDVPTLSHFKSRYKELQERHIKLKALHSNIHGILQEKVYQYTQLCLSRKYLHLVLIFETISRRTADFQDLNQFQSDSSSSLFELIRRLCTIKNEAFKLFSARKNHLSSKIDQILSSVLTNYKHLLLDKLKENLQHIGWPIVASQNLINTTKDSKNIEQLRSSLSRCFFVYSSLKKEFDQLLDKETLIKSLNNAFFTCFSSLISVKFNLFFEEGSKQEIPIKMMVSHICSWSIYNVRFLQTNFGSILSRYQESFPLTNLIVQQLNELLASKLNQIDFKVLDAKQFFHLIDKIMEEDIKFRVLLPSVPVSESNSIMSIFISSSAFDAWMANIESIQNAVLKDLMSRESLDWTLKFGKFVNFQKMPNFFFSLWSVMSSLLLYSRVILPVNPKKATDLVAKCFVPFTTCIIKELRYLFEHLISKFSEKYSENQICFRSLTRQVKLVNILEIIRKNFACASFESWIDELYEGEIFQQMQLQETNKNFLKVYVDQLEALEGEILEALNSQTNSDLAATSFRHFYRTNMSTEVECRLPAGIHSIEHLLKYFASPDASSKLENEK